MTRVGAFLIHLGISFAIFLALAYLIVFVWYPDFFFSTDGGWQGMRIIVAVDLVLGPALTLIVFKPGKPGLKFDLTLIGLFQSACLIAGTYVVYSERPLAMVYVDGQFFSMSADSYGDYGVEVPDLEDFPGPWPKWVTVQLPQDIDAAQALRRSALRKQQPLRTFAQRYVPFSTEHLNLDGDLISPAELTDRDQDSGQTPLWLDRHGGTLEDYVFFPFRGRHNFVFVGVNRRDKTIRGLLKTPAPL